jgi:hypothetical protein
MENIHKYLQMDPAALFAGKWVLSLIALGLQITFNGGGRWEELQKPEHYRHAVCNRCAAMHDPSKCQLHLHGPSSWHEGPGELYLHQQTTELFLQHFSLGFRERALIIIISTGNAMVDIVCRVDEGLKILLYRKFSKNDPGHQQMLETCEEKHLAKTTNTVAESPARFVRKVSPNIQKCTC